MATNVKKKIIAVLILTVIAGFAGYKYFTRSKENPYDFVLAEKGDVSREVSATGTVKPGKKINLQFQNQGKIKLIKVKVGDKVKEGEKLAELDAAEINTQLLEKQATLELAQAKLDQLLAGASGEDIKVTETAVLNAQENLAKTKESASKDIASTEATVNSSQISLKNAVQNLADVKGDAEQDLRNNYQSALNEIYDGYLQADKAMTYLDDIFEDYPNGYAIETCFSCSDLQKKSDAELQKSRANNALAKIIAANNNLLIDSSKENIDAAAIEFKEQLEIIRLALSLTSDVLDKSSINSNLCPSKSLINGKTNIETSRANLNTAIADIMDAEQDINSVKITNQADINTAQAAVDSKQAASESAQQSLAAAKATADKQIVIAEGQLKTAADQLALKKAPPRQTDIALRQAEIKQAEANLSYINEQLKQSVLFSPIEGVITNIDGEAGEIAKTGENIVSIMSFFDFQVESDIPEADIAHIAVNNPVEIFLDAFDGEKWTGKVISIDPAEKIIAGVVYYKTTIAFNQIDKRIASGMTTNITILTAKKENVLLIPQRAVTEKNGRKTVEILKNDKEMKEVEVETGLKGSRGEIEIISGLQQGDKIITFIKKND